MPVRPRNGGRHLIENSLEDSLELTMICEMSIADDQELAIWPENLAAWETCQTRRLQWPVRDERGDYRESSLQSHEGYHPVHGWPETQLALVRDRSLSNWLALKREQGKTHR